MGNSNGRKPPNPRYVPKQHGRKPPAPPPHRTSGKGPAGSGGASKSMVVLALLMVAVPFGAIAGSIAFVAWGYFA